MSSHGVGRSRLSRGPARCRPAGSASASDFPSPSLLSGCVVLSQVPQQTPTLPCGRRGAGKDVPKVQPSGVAWPTALPLRGHPLGPQSPQTPRLPRPLEPPSEQTHAPTPTGRVLSAWLHYKRSGACVVPEAGGEERPDRCDFPFGSVVSASPPPLAPFLLSFNLKVVVFGKDPWITAPWYRCCCCAARI